MANKTKKSYKFNSWSRDFALVPFIPLYIYASYGNATGAWNRSDASADSLAPKQIFNNTVGKLFRQPLAAIMNIAALTLLTPICLSIAAVWYPVAILHDIYSGVRSFLFGSKKNISSSEPVDSKNSQSLSILSEDSLSEETSHQANVNHAGKNTNIAYFDQRRSSNRTQPTTSEFIQKLVGCINGIKEEDIQDIKLVTPGQKYIIKVSGTYFNAIFVEQAFRKTLESKSPRKLSEGIRFIDDNGVTVEKITKDTHTIEIYGKAAELLNQLLVENNDHMYSSQMR
ncbi:hypothetical protein ACFORL_05685 [Legionella dresdenensis]|uniref:Uncharacterized protein n=1 Tax=Legionella dresdenensis TaxID=450200 RepID=A0ABV8CE96_9GAMM